MSNYPMDQADPRIERLRASPFVVIAPYQSVGGDDSCEEEVYLCDTLEQARALVAKNPALGRIILTGERCAEIFTT